MVIHMLANVENQLDARSSGLSKFWGVPYSSGLNMLVGYLYSGGLSLFCWDVYFGGLSLFKWAISILVGCFI